MTRLCREADGATNLCCRVQPGNAERRPRTQRERRADGRRQRCLRPPLRICNGLRDHAWRRQRGRWIAEGTQASASASGPALVGPAIVASDMPEGTSSRQVPIASPARPPVDTAFSPPAEARHRGSSPCRRCEAHIPGLVPPKGGSQLERAAVEAAVPSTNTAARWGLPTSS